VVGVVLFVVNAAFSLVLLILIIVTTTVIFFRKNPDARYQFMADDRASFMKSQTQLNTTTELDALAATARGDKAGYKSHLDLDDDNESITSESIRRRMDPANVALPPSTTQSAAQSQHSLHHGHHPPNSPIDPSMPLFPADPRGRGQHHAPYGHHGNDPYQRHQAPGGMNRSPSPYNGSSSNVSSAYRSQHNASPMGYRSQNNASSPWQRGAGYDHS
jgi:hypothetical protein